MEYSNSEMQVIGKAIKLIKPFCFIEIATYRTYFTDKTGKEIGEDFDCCGNSKCVSIVKKEIQKHYPKIHIASVFTYNDIDHEEIKFCYGCELPMNSCLTWVKYELAHFALNILTKKDMIKQINAFCIHAIFCSIPSYDKYLDKSQVMDYAKLVISELEK